MVMCLLAHFKTSFFFFTHAHQQQERDWKALQGVLMILAFEAIKTVSPWDREIDFQGGKCSGDRLIASVGEEHWQVDGD